MKVGDIISIAEVRLLLFFRLTMDRMANRDDS